jgi:hypothetical protein
MNKNDDKNWGGKRPGAGRPAGAAKKETEKLSQTIAFCVTQEEKEAWKKLDEARKEELKKRFREGIMEDN